MNGLREDLLYAVRQIPKYPGFSAVVVLTLALGIGANTAIFNVIEAVLLRPLPFPQPERLIWLNGKMPQTDEAGISTPDFVDYRANNNSFEQLAAMSQQVLAGPANLSGDRRELVTTSLISANFFSTLGIHPLLGRDFERSDEEAEKPNSVILGYGIWIRDFGSNRGILGRNIRLDGESLTVVGVLPRDLPFLSAAEIWRPIPLQARLMHLRMAHFLGVVIGRLKPGVSIQQSQADLDAIATSLAEKYPDTDKGWSVRQRPLNEVLVGSVRPALLIMWAASAALLLIACANLANIFLTRAVARQQEVAVRTALGASIGRIMRQSIIESLMLAGCGGLVGTLAAAWVVHMLQLVGPLDLPRLQEIHADASVVAFAFGLSLLAGCVLGLAPALQLPVRTLGEILKKGRRSSASLDSKNLRSGLVVLEVSLSLALLVGAGLLIKSFWLLVHVNPGFEAQNVITSQLVLAGPAYAEEGRRVRFWEQFQEQISALPGVASVGATSELPLSGQHSDNPFHIPGRTYGPSDFDDAYFRQVTPGYLSTLRIPLVAGRWITSSDGEHSPGIVVVNQAFARRFFAGQDVVGKQLQLMGDPAQSREIVGVIGDIKHTALSDPEEPEMYVPYAQYPPPTMNLVIRAGVGGGALSSSVRRILASLDKDETLSAVIPLEQVVAASVAQSRFSSLLLGCFAALALILSAIGLYGTVSYSVSRRTNEIGIRMALGAQKADVLNMVVLQGMKLVLIGAVLGLAGALAFSKFLANMLYGVKPADIFILTSVSLILLTVAVFATYFPARRAAKIDPLAALHYE